MSTENPVEMASEESPTLAALAAALAKAQGMFTEAKKDSENPHFRSKYADLASIWSACREALSANGLAVMQRVTTVEAGVSVTTQLLHSSGEWVKDRAVFPVAQRTPQGIGAAITYGRRYALAALVGVASGEDDDGNADSVPMNQGRKTAPQPSAKTARAPEPKKEPPPEPKADQTEAAALKVRKTRLWQNFTKAGGTKDDWAGWLAQCLGEVRTSDSLTLADVAKLDMELANGLSLIPEPPDEPEPPPPSEPPAEEEVISPLVRLTSLAAKHGTTLQSVLQRAEKLCGKTGGWSHADVEAVRAELAKGAK